MLTLHVRLLKPARLQSKRTLVFCRCVTLRRSRLASRPTVHHLASWRMQVLCSCPTQKLGRQLILHRGLHPLVLENQSPSQEQPRAVARVAASAGFCKPGDTVVVAYRDYQTPDEEVALKIVTASVTSVTHCSMLHTVLSSVLRDTLLYSMSSAPPVSVRAGPLASFLVVFARLMTRPRCHASFLFNCTLHMHMPPH